MKHSLLRKNWPLVCGLLFLLVSLLALPGCAAVGESNDEPTLVSTSTAAAPPEPTQIPVMPERRLIQLEWPERVRAKDSDVIILSLLVDEDGLVTATQLPGHSVEELPVEIPNLYESHNVVAVARLDLAGIDSWRDELREPVRPGRPVTFTWSVRADEAGSYRGVVWLWLEFVPKDGGPVDSMTLLSRLIEIDAVTVLGLPGWLGRLVGGTGLLVSTVLGYPFIQSLVERLFRKRQVPVKQNPGESNHSA